MLFVTELLMWLFVGIVAASVFMGLSIAHRLRLPKIEGWAWRSETRHWPRRWAFLLGFLLLTKSLAEWERAYPGRAFWPEWKWELALFVVLSGLFSLFTRAKANQETSGEMEA